MAFKPAARAVPFLLCLFATQAALAQAETAPADDDLIARREDDVRREVLKTFEDEILNAQDKFRDLKTKASSLSDQIQALLTNDTGKRLARDPLAIVTFIQIRDEPAPSVQQIDRKAAAVDAALKAVEEKLARPRVDLPSPQQRCEILDAYSWARGNADRIADRLDFLQALLATTAGNDDVSKVPTLDAAIKEYKNRFTRVFAQRWLEGEEKAAERAQKTLTDTAEKAVLERAAQEAKLKMEKAVAEVERLKAEHEVELRQLREKQEKRIADIERELALAKAARLKQQAETIVIAKQAQQDADLILKKKQARDPEVQQLLAPFIAPGYYQPKYPRGEIGVQKIPMSYAKLQAFGALQPDTNGLQKLIQVATWSGDKARPRWSYNWRAHKLKPEEIEEVTKAQRFLIELGPVMVQEGILSP